MSGGGPLKAPRSARVRIVNAMGHEVEPSEQNDNEDAAVTELLLVSRGATMYEERHEYVSVGSPAACPLSYVGWLTWQSWFGSKPIHD